MSDIVPELSNLAKDFKPGLYKHFKGGMYEGLMMGRLSESRDEEFVIYRSIEKRHTWIRPIKMFFEEVDRDGYKGPRFVLVSGIKERGFYQVSLKVIFKNEKGEILGLKNVNKGPHAGFYDLPGGRINQNEFYTDFKNIIERELEEEVGEIKFNLKEKPVAVARHMVPGGMTNTGEPVPVLQLYFEAEYLEGEIKISGEHSDYKWIDINNINVEEFFTAGILE